VHQRREPDSRLGREVRRRLQHELHVEARIDLRMPLLGLRHSVERVELRQDARERAAIVQQAQPRLRRRLAERSFGLLPDALGHEGVHFAGGDHGAHARKRLGCDRETERLEAGEETGDAQDPDRVLVEGLGNVAQDARLEIRLAAAGIDERAVRVPRHRVDGQVAAPEVLFERDVG
jgi:hypothetical protein